MIFAYVKSGEVVKISNSNKIEWDDMVYSNIELMLPDERKALGIYEFSPKLSISDYHNKGLVSYNIDNASGIVYELVEEIPFTSEEMNGLKNRIWEMIKGYREAKVLDGIKVNGKWFHTDLDSRIKYISLKHKANDLIASGKTLTDKVMLSVNGASTEVQWKTMDGTFVALTIQDVFDINNALTELELFTFMVTEQHKIKLFESDEPLKYDYSIGFPLTYKDELKMLAEV